MIDYSKLSGPEIAHNDKEFWNFNCNGKPRNNAKYCHCCGHGVLVKNVPEYGKSFFKGLELAGHILLGGK